MFKQLRHFQSVVRLNSFSAAAEENYISQSAITRQVQALERELGFQLLERKNRLFALTEAGAYFYQKSLVLTADYERMCAEAAKIAHGDGASLTIGSCAAMPATSFTARWRIFRAAPGCGGVGGIRQSRGAVRLAAHGAGGSGAQRSAARVFGRIRQSAFDRLPQLC